MPDPLTQHDDRQHRCPMLGGDVPFRYCRTMNDQLPCAKLEQCWQGKLAVETFLREGYTEDELRQSATSKGRLETIFETLAQVKDEG